AGVYGFEQGDGRILVVDADAAFHRGGDADRLADGGHAVRDQRRLAHQAGAEAARLHTVGRAADVQVDLVIAEGRADAGRLGQLLRLGPAQLQRHRVLDGVEPQ